MFPVQMNTMELLLLLSLLLTGSLIQSVEGGVVVKEDSDAVLPCSPSTKENIEKEVFDWKKDDHKEVFHYNGGDYYGHGLSGQDKQFEGRVSHFNDELKNGNASIKIRKTKVADSGLYTCDFPRLRQEFLIELVVEPEESTQGFSAGWIVAAVVITLLVVGVIILAALFATGCISCRKGRTEVSQTER